MENSFLPLILQTIATVVTVLTLYWRISKSHNEKQDARIGKIKSDYDEKISKIETEMGNWESRRRADVRALHKRVDEQDDFVKTSIIGQLSRMEGEMKGMSNILQVIQEYFVNTGAGKR